MSSAVKNLSHAGGLPLEEASGGPPVLTDWADLSTDLADLSARSHELFRGGAQPHRHKVLITAKSTPAKTMDLPLGEASGGPPVSTD